jgi:hypothetical protein
MIVDEVAGDFLLERGEVGEEDPEVDKCEDGEENEEDCLATATDDTPVITIAAAGRKRKRKKNKKRGAISRVRTQRHHFGNRQPASRR